MCRHEEHHGGHGRGCAEQHEQPDCGCHEHHHPHHAGPGRPGVAFGRGSGHERGFPRRFLTRAEQIERLDAYLHDVQAEAQAVTEKLAALRAEGA